MANKDKKSVIIRLTHTYTYPHAMLEKGAPLQDAMAKMEEDLIEDLHEGLANPEHFRESFFETAIHETLPFDMRQPVIIPMRRDARFVMDFQRLVQLLTTSDIERKYKKPLDPEKSPDLFVEDGPFKRLKPEIESEYYNLSDHYISLLNNAERI